jgi:hypothetical protein
MRKSSGQKYDVVIQRDAVSDHDVPRVPRHLNLAVPAISAPRSRRRTIRNHMATAPGYRISRLIKSSAIIVEDCRRPLAFGGPTRAVQ